MSEEILNYFQRVLSGKMEKGDWLILLILFSIIFVLSWWLGGPVGGFTFILAVATIWNIRITQGLLKQSKEAIEIDTFNKIVSSGSQLNAELRDTKKFPQEERPDYVENFAVGMLVTLKNIDPTMFERIGEAIKTWNKTDDRTPATTYLNALNKIKEYQKIEKKELNKCEK